MQTGYRFTRTWAHHLAIVLTPETHAALMAMQQPGQPRALARRARVICLRAEGVPYAEVQRQTGMTMNHIFKWVRRYAREGIQGLQHRNKARPRVRRSSFRVQDGDRAALERWSRLEDSPRVAVRAQAVLWRTEGVSGAAVAARLQVSRQAVHDWQRRYRTQGLRGLCPRPRGRPRR